MRSAANHMMFVAVAIAALVGLRISAIAQGPCPCQLQDNGAGTITMPPDCPDGYRCHLEIVDGLTSATIEIDAALLDLTNVIEIVGGVLGGTHSMFDALLLMQMSGTGALNGFVRTLHMPVSGVIDWGPRIPNDAVQAFPAEIVELSGHIFGDTDFDEILFRTGLDLGLPAPGETTLTRVGGIGSDFQVDSFFDITYQIEFVGALGSVLEGAGGTTTRTTRIEVCPGPSPVEEVTWGTVKALYR